MVCLCTSMCCARSLFRQIPGKFLLKWTDSCTAVSWQTDKPVTPLGAECTATVPPFHLGCCKRAFRAPLTFPNDTQSKYCLGRTCEHAVRPQWTHSPSPTLPPTYRKAVGLRSCLVARSTRTGLLSRHGIFDISASHHPMVYIR